MNPVVAHTLTCYGAKMGDPTTDNYVVTSFHMTQDPITERGFTPVLSSSARVGVMEYNDRIAHTLRAEGADASEDGTGRGVPLVIDTTQITSAENRNNPQYGDPCHPLSASAHPPLLVSPSVRRLTPVECERLQGFPDDWTSALSDSQRYRVLGNAVAVPVVEWIAKRIMECERE